MLRCGAAIGSLPYPFYSRPQVLLAVCFLPWPRHFIYAPCTAGKEASKPALLGNALLLSPLAVACGRLNGATDIFTLAKQDANDNDLIHKYNVTIMKVVTCLTFTVKNHSNVVKREEAEVRIKHEWFDVQCQVMRLRKELRKSKKSNYMHVQADNNIMR
ncbi:hypothetical protein NDU88_007537 [Pleurodeles waltl]|uniref:Uncharacterized protein n=1 Tax=Pleurodeles waltl TaxID=8319 RepID=A0AAV7U0N1_PLEWA|nr:hypothetical protein NDU88_007537 [Pleurodeles waltl]